MAAPSSSSSSRSTSKTIVLVSGGNTGIGYEIVKKLASEHPSYQILMGSRDVHKAESAAASLGAPGNVNPIQLDISSDESISHCYKTIEQHFGRLDVLINNAGTAGKDMRRSGTSLPLREIYIDVFSVNVTGTALLTEAMLPLLSQASQNPPPRIVFITSSLGSIAQVLEKSAAADLIPTPFYSSSKSAVNYLCAYYSKKYEAQGWKVNACCPGLMATGLHASHLELTDETHPRLGAINAVRLATLGREGETGTYSNTEGVIPW